MHVKGIALQFSTDELAEDKGLWWDADKHHDQANAKNGKPGFGIVIGLRAGRWYEPFGASRAIGANRWTSGKHWFVVPRIPFVYPFLSVAIGRFGFYVGWKAYGVDWPEYKAWARAEDIKTGNTALTLSASFRRSRVT